MDIIERLPQSIRGRSGLIVGLSIVVAVLVLIALRRGAEEHAPLEPAALTVTTTTLERVEVARSITANGSIHPWQEIIIGPEVGGYRVAAVHVDVGDRVERGQELLKLRDELLSAELASKRANLLQAQAALERAAADFRRAQSLSASGALSQSDLDELRSEEIAAEARLASAKADLEAAQLRLKYTRVTAPDDGIISARNVTVGQVAQSGAELLRLIRKGRVEWRAEVPESRLGAITAGQTVRLTTADGARLEGKVRTVAPTVDTATRVGLVYVDIDSEHVRPGMFARGEILVERSEAAMLPLSSIVIHDGYSYVYVVKEDGIVERRHVETGLVEDQSIEILAGLAHEERIVATGAGFLKDGDRVKVVKAGTE